MSSAIKVVLKLISESFDQSINLERVQGHGTAIQYRENRTHRKEREASVCSLDLTSEKNFLILKILSE